MRALAEKLKLVELPGGIALDGTHRQADTLAMLVDVFHRHGWSFIPSVRQKRSKWQGGVAVRATNATRVLYLCQREREMELETFEDAIQAAFNFTEMI